MTARLRAAHIWEQDPHGFYIEPHWCSERLFQVEHFTGTMLDPCAGSGRIVTAARSAGYNRVYAGDIVRRSFQLDFEIDFFRYTIAHDNVVSNPPFDRIQEIVEHALKIATRKVAMIIPCRRLNAAGEWLSRTPLYRIHFLTPRPSMPPGHWIEAGGKVGGGVADYCWCVWLRDFDDAATVHWLDRDGDQL
jgi:hypothetical protein